MMPPLLRYIAVLTAALAGALLPAAAMAARSGWADAVNARLRLLALPESGGTIRAGVEIALDPGWHTYWRNPGDAGVPPRFDFSGSDNLATVEIGYPVPERLDDGTTMSAVYNDQVVFPVRITAKDASAPVTLRLAASFGLCREVCIPAQTETELQVPASGDDPLTTATLTAAAKRLPGPPAPGRFVVEHVALDGPDALAITVRMPPASYADLFVDGPQGWPIGLPAAVSRDGDLAYYRLSLIGRPDSSSASGKQFRFVAVSGSEAVEQTVQVP